MHRSVRGIRLGTCCVVFGSFQQSERTCGLRNRIRIVLPIGDRERSLFDRRTLCGCQSKIAVHDAALQALAGIGCEVKKDTADLIEGKRPNKVGLAVGSGGEKLFVTIKDAGNGRTEFKVTTKKTLLGIAGQKRWNDEVAAKIVEIVK